jgi:hypothetical protein
VKRTVVRFDNETYRIDWERERIYVTRRARFTGNPVRETVKFANSRNFRNVAHEIIDSGEVL